MKDLSNPKVVKDIAKKYGFFFKKGLGQNFLTDKNTLDRIIEVANIDNNSVVLEIGPGFGTLTQRLCAYAKKVIAVEIDKNLIPVLNETLNEFDNIEIINEDILKLDTSKILKDNENIKVVANLPYYITTPIIMELLFKKFPASKMVFMVQKEVAQRIVASSGSKDYGALTIAVNYFSNAKIAQIVPASSFVPPPKVDSAVVVLDILSEPKGFVKDENKFFKVVRASFSQRRKTLKNALINSGYFKITKTELDDLLVKLCKNAEIRGEQLDIYKFMELSNEIF